MSALGPSEISLRRRPLLVLAICTVRLVLGFCLSLPLASLVAGSGVGQRAEGDRALFEAGGYLLLELLRTQGDALSATLRGLSPLLGLGLLVGAACNLVLMIALNVRGRLASFAWLGQAWARFPAQLVISAGAGLSKLLLVVLATIALGAVPAWATEPIATTLAQAASVLPFLLALGAVGGFEDVAKAALVRHEATLQQGLARAVLCARRRPLLALWGWLPYAALLGLAALVAAELTAGIDVAGASATRVVAVFVAHQLVVAIGITCRAAWFARALRLAATT
jgi:hypothetical protein